MLIKHAADIPESDVTPERVYLKRREFMKISALAGAAALTCGPALAGGKVLVAHPAEAKTRQLDDVIAGPFSTDQPANSWTDITTYNNYYEFGTAKDDPARNAADFKPLPWTLKVGGECNRPGTYHYEDLVSPYQLEERIYRLRCVEAWSMVVPWVGLPLASLLKRFEPTSAARYVQFKTLYDPARMPGQRRRILDWPYREGLTIAEAMHPLTLMAVGLYGRTLPNQNGAPLRLVVPWKYGFKSIKAITEINFVEKQPRTSWQMAAPAEYGFYANVNPHVDHPRWSQARERVIGANIFAPKKPTLMFNGYGEQVASLYTGLDLRKNF
jgi:sulfoxide reductase catalytic subunit YedY